MNELSQSQKEIAISFAEAISSFNIDAISTVLDDAGKFQVYRGIGFECDMEEEVNKEEYLDYIFGVFENYRSKNPESGQLNYVFDHCLQCKFGHQVVVFENGTFPHKTKVSWAKAKLGLALSFEEDKITEITFCGAMLLTDNKYNKEIEKPKYDKK